LVAKAPVSESASAAAYDDSHTLARAESSHVAVFTRLWRYNGTLAVTTNAFTIFFSFSFLCFFGTARRLRREREREREREGEGERESSVGKVKEHLLLSEY
jgi:hypothetical protein